ncbi:hypothetical protein EI94DRAFT_1703636 [Lactarius quietus]|nr:hypothetical protein EI94DRAFT_1703636 [Lactarius quietus]
MAEIQTCLDKVFMLTPEQKMNICFVTGELLLNPNRVCYTQLSIMWRSGSVKSRRSSTFSISLETWPINVSLGAQSDILAQAYEMLNKRCDDLPWSTHKSWTEWLKKMPMTTNRLKTGAEATAPNLMVLILRNQCGMSWNTPGWTIYIENTIDQDHKKFKPAPCVNPFIGDPRAVAAECEGGVRSVDPWAISAIGSMQGILGSL